MDADGHRRLAGAAPQGVGRSDWTVSLLSAAGLFFILIGLAALALPSGQEGELLWQLGPQQALYWMDVAGFAVSLLGVALTWMGGWLWKRSLSRGRGGSTSSASGSPPPAA